MWKIIGVKILKGVFYRVRFDFIYYFVNIIELELQLVMYTKYLFIVVNLKKKNVVFM